MDDKWRKEALGKRIRAAREALNMSQKDLYDKTKIKDSMISDFERGVREPSTANLAKIAHALDTTMDKLYFGDESTSFIESVPDRGMQIVNCFTLLFLSGTISKVEDESEYGMGGTQPHVNLWNHAWAVKRLLGNLDEYKRNILTYPDPGVYLEQIKKSVANEINENCKKDK